MAGFGCCLGFLLFHRFAVFGAVRLSFGEVRVWDSPWRGEGSYAAEVFDGFFYVFVVEAEDFEIGRAAVLIGRTALR
jgi:hypothetical protein